MVHIPDFRRKWDICRPRAHLISPHFPAGERITLEKVATRIPRDPDSPIPAPECEAIHAEAFRQWLATDNLPEDRRRQWEELTRIPVDIWELDVAGFERTVRTRAGVVLGWEGLVQARATSGVIRVRAEDRSPTLRMLPEGIDPFGKPPPVQLVWPGCIARIYLRSPQPKPEDEDRRAWMLSDYGTAIYMLDPALPSDGSVTKPSSRIGRSSWREGPGGGYLLLPRGRPGYVWVAPSTPLGIRFDVLVLVLNFSSQPDEIRSLFDALEQHCLVDGKTMLTPGYQKTMRTTLNEAASLIDGHEIGCALHRQKCEVVARELALGGAHG